MISTCASGSSVFRVLAMSVPELPLTSSCRGAYGKRCSGNVLVVWRSTTTTTTTRRPVPVPVRVRSQARWRGSKVACERACGARLRAHVHRKPARPKYNQRKIKYKCRKRNACRVVCVCVRDADCPCRSVT